MVDVKNLNLVLTGLMDDSSPEALERLKTALDGGYEVYVSGNKILIFESTEE